MSWGSLVGLAVVGNLGAAFQADAAVLASARTRLVRARTARLKRAIRGDVVRAGLGARFAHIVRSAVQPAQGMALDPAGAVFSSGIVKGRKGGTVDLLTVFAEGAYITRGGAGYLAIPLPAAGRGPRGRKPTPADFPEGALIFVAATSTEAGRFGLHSGAALLLDAATREPFFVLVRAATVGRRLDLDRRYAEAVDNLDAAEVQEWEKLVAQHPLATQIRTLRAGVGV